MRDSASIPSAPEPAKRSTTRVPSWRRRGDGRGCRRSIRAGAPTPVGPPANSAHEARALSACRRRCALLRSRRPLAVGLAAARRGAAFARGRAFGESAAPATDGPRRKTRAFQTACLRRVARSEPRRTARRGRLAALGDGDGLRREDARFSNGLPSPRSAGGCCPRTGVWRSSPSPSVMADGPRRRILRFLNGLPSPRGEERASTDGARWWKGLPPSRDGGRPSPEEPRFSNGLPSPRGAERASTDGARWWKGLPPSRDGGRPSPGGTTFFKRLAAARRARRPSLSLRRGPFGQCSRRAVSASRWRNVSGVATMRSTLISRPLRSSRRVRCVCAGRWRSARSRRAARRRACVCAAPARARARFCDRATRLEAAAIGPFAPARPAALAALGRAAPAGGAAPP